MTGTFYICVSFALSPCLVFLSYPGVLWIQFDDERSDLPPARRWIKRQANFAPHSSVDCDLMSGPTRCTFDAVALADCEWNCMGRLFISFGLIHIYGATYLWAKCLACSLYKLGYPLTALPDRFLPPPHLRFSSPPSPFRPAHSQDHTQTIHRGIGSLITVVFPSKPCYHKSRWAVRSTKPWTPLPESRHHPPARPPNNVELARAKRQRRRGSASRLTRLSRRNERRGKPNESTDSRFSSWVRARAVRQILPTCLYFPRPSARRCCVFIPPSSDRLGFSLREFQIFSIVPASLPDPGTW